MIKELIREYRNSGIELWCENRELRYRAPKEAMNPRLIAELKRHKPAIIEELSRAKWDQLERDAEESAKVKEARIVNRTEARGTSKTCLYVEAADSAAMWRGAHWEHLADVVGAAWDRETKGINRLLVNEWVDAAEKMALTEMFRLFIEKGVFEDTAAIYTLREIAAKIHAAPKYERLLSRWLRVLTKAGIISASEQGFKLAHGIPEEQKREVWNQFQAIETRLGHGAGFFSYLKKCSGNLGALFKGKVEPLELLFPQGDMTTAIDTYRNTMTSQVLNSIAVDVVLAAAEHYKPGDQPLRILELGAGVGGTSDGIISRLSGENMEYVYSDVSRFFLNNARQRYEGKDWVKYKILDINKGYIMEDTDPPQFDIILAANVLHNAQHGPQLMQWIHELLKPAGIVVVLDAVKEPLYLLTSIGFIDGLLDFRDFRKDRDTALFERDEWVGMFREADAEVIAAYPGTDDALFRTGQGIFVFAFPERKIQLTPEEVMHDLRQRVGADDLPDSIEILSRIPGHVRKGKKEPVGAEDRSQEGTNPDAAPVGGIECQLARIWKKVLNCQRVGRHDNFFMLGGDSLLVSQALAEMMEQITETKEWQWGDLLKVMLSSPTIAEVAAQMRKKGGAESRDFVTLIEPRGRDSGAEEIVYVLFHTGTGSLTPYADFVKELTGSDFPHKLIGFACNEVRSFLDIPEHKLFSELGNRYAESLLKISPRRFVLMGHCVGGLIALETARTLSGHGVVAEEVVLISTHIYAGDDSCAKLRKQEFSSDIILEKMFGRLLGAEVEKAGFLIDDDRLRAAINRIKLENNGEFREELLAELEGEYTDVGETYRALLGKSHTERLRGLLNTAAGNILRVQKGQERMLLILYNLFKQSFAATCYYKPREYTGRACVLKCRAETKNYFVNTFSEFSASDSAWGQYLTGGRQSAELAGDHFSCMDSSHIKQNLDKLISALKTRAL